jgi:hypothetical protein
LSDEQIKFRDARENESFQVSDSGQSSNTRPNFNARQQLPSTVFSHRCLHDSASGPTLWPEAKRIIAHNENLRKLGQ